MDRKQPFLLVLMIVMFGVAVASAIWVFGERNTLVRRDAIVSGIQHIAADAHAWRLRPATLGGGGGSYRGYAIPAGLRESELATCTVDPSSSPDTLIVVAAATRGSGSVTASIDPRGTLSIVRFGGEFSP